MKSWFKIESKSGVARIDIYDEIGIFGITAKDFINEYKKIKEKNVELHINSPGGSVFEGMAIYTNLKNSDKEIDSFIDGLAASMASVISLAGKKVYMPDNAMFMIHNPAGIAFGESEEMKKMADLLDKIQGQIAQIYADKTGKSLEEIKEKMDEETWFTGKEAKEYGFVDELTGEVKLAANFDFEKAGFKNLNKLLLAIQNNKEPNKNPKPNGGKPMEPKTVAELKTAYPALCAELEEALKASLQKEFDTQLETAQAEAAQKERERVKAIQELPVVGEDAQKIIDAAIADPKATKETTAMKLLEAQGKGEKVEVKAREADAAATNKELSNIDKATNASPDETKQDDAEAKEAAIAAGCARPDVVAAARN